MDEQNRSRSLDDVPVWLGWMVVPAAFVLSIIGVWLYSWWAYRRGCRDGAGREATEGPDTGFGWQAVAFSLIALIPLLGWIAAVRLATMSYKRGLRVGARDGKAGAAFTSVPALIAAIATPWIALFAGAFVVGFIQGYADAVEEQGVTQPAAQPVKEETQTTWLTGGEAAGKAEAWLRTPQVLASRVVVECDPEDYNGRTNTWIILCALSSANGRTATLRLTVADATGRVGTLK